MGVLILGVNTLYRLFCFFKLFVMVGKGLINVDTDLRDETFTNLSLFEFEVGHAEFSYSLV